MFSSLENEMNIHTQEAFRSSTRQAREEYIHNV